MEAVGKTLKQRSSHEVLPVVFYVGGPMRGADQHWTAADTRDRKIDAVHGSAECHRLFEMCSRDARRRPGRILARCVRSIARL